MIEGGVYLDFLLHTGHKCIPLIFSCLIVWMALREMNALLNCIVRFLRGIFAAVTLKTRQGSPVDGKPSVDEAPPIGIIHPVSKIAVTLEPVMRFGCSLIFRISYKTVNLSIFWLKAPTTTIRVWRRRKDIFTKDHSINESQWCL